ncbi:MAG: 30S ribosomal protein S19 [Nanoarchaeota archaeon]|nr:30S ribosomal protein S19 [Nanoarchaeota archaeon]MBU1445012.1 30S ribosomal protein S19 [Nanoarchaeota archaeon]MBU2406406.1 30S ribosomal protein S19 [Nanoarchaeota archaeon]MBU2420022.1 30S ribosomal protein S19 [Nanoarchaeota archaeon]MBU2475498.1 30S ribosomal protein S19 [Nanoarchaeota archaeon]
MAKEFKFKGKTLEEIKQMPLSEFAKLISSRERRKLLRGFTDAEKRLLLKVKEFKEGKRKKNIKTHCRDMIVIPGMIDLMIYVHSGKVFMPIQIIPEMLGHRLGEYVPSRQKVSHSAPGIGATRSSAFASVK